MKAFEAKAAADAAKKAAEKAEEEGEDVTWQEIWEAHHVGFVGQKSGEKRYPKDLIGKRNNKQNPRCVFFSFFLFLVTHGPRPW